MNSAVKNVLRDDMTCWVMTFNVVNPYFYLYFSEDWLEYYVDVTDRGSELVSRFPGVDIGGLRQSSKAMVYYQITDYRHPSHPRIMFRGSEMEIVEFRLVCSDHIMDIREWTDE